MTHVLFTRPAFTARTVAEALGRELGRPLAFTDADEEADGCVDVTSRVHVQVGADYLVVGAWVDETTLRTWPLRASIARALRDLEEAVRDFPGVQP
jgi:hypothetical protein